ncbi:TonB-dependent receptor [Sphingomonas carotinifaciens]|uniref:TonB-dependent receptor n=1 Tax=Sphingomonas carotinifaciens TaxID=1166323 RepID=A0A1G7S522_9SPHN|nr:TonB-dependent receptor [Sphingomonas carotinifaciens]MBB4088193.1 TonB-dependent receptor [Sphingomonas carotinifaciens]MWC42196.1 TonB-dependent receptor [Sphingomonas carotinifaciens]SDG18052.1 TonB-dependent receptor [Sphingomonas carotinifaciens]
MKLFTIRRGLLLLSTALSPAAYAQEVSPVPAESEEEIVVTGARLQAVREIEAKRAISVISDSISSDEIGTLPDFGLGEALTRVPGVSTIQNNARGEAQFLSIRGLNADYNLVQIDGVTLPANEIGRRNVSMDVIPSSLASRVEVYKSVTAAMNGNAIGGTANLRTRSAFDGKGRSFLGGRFDIGEWDFKRTRGNRGPSGQAELIASTTFGPDRKFGVVVSGSYFRRDSASLNSATDNYLYFDPTTGVRLTSPANDVSNALVAPDRRRWLHYDNVRERYGVFGKLEFDDHRMFKAALTLADFRHTNDEERQSNLVTANTGVTTATNRYTNFTNVTAGGGNVGNAAAQVDLAEYDQTRRMRYADFHGELAPTDRIRADFGVNYAIATYRQDATFATYRITNTPNLAYRYEITPGKFTYFDFANPAIVSGAANYKQFEYGTNSDDNRENALTARANIGVNMGSDDRGFGLAAGAYGRFLDRRYDFAVDNFRNTAASTLLLTPALASESYAPYNGRGYRMLFVDPDAARQAFDANRGSFAANPANAGGNLQEDYRLTEDIAAAYLMARYATDTVRLTAGLRYEGTRLTTTSNSLRAGVYTPSQQGQSYRDWLPSAQADWDVSDRLRLRAAFSRTLGRPNYDDLAAREVVNVNSSTGAVSVTSGNPSLNPRRSDNYDISIEYYVNNDVLFSAAAFAKRIDDEIVTVRNQATELFDGQQQLVTRIQPVNAGRATVKGVELNAVVARMRFLPGPLDGFGFSANLTLLDPTPPEVTLADNVTRRRLSGLFESANTVANVKLFYNTGPLMVQGAWNRLSPILYSVSTTDPLQDRRYATSDLFDAQIRLKLDRHWTIVAQGRNLTNFRPQRMFGPGFGLLREEIDNGRAFYIGALVRY